MSEEQKTDAPVLAVMCGACRFGVATSPDLRQALNCTRFPPQVVGGLIPGPQGQPVIVTNSYYPQVARNNRACGEFETRLQS